MKIAELPFRELAIWRNSKGTYILFYLHNFDEKRSIQRIVWTSNPIYENTFGIVSNNAFCEEIFEDIEVTPLGLKVTEDTNKLWQEWWVNKVKELREAGVI